MINGAYYKHDSGTDMVINALFVWEAPEGKKVMVNYCFRSAVDGHPISHGVMELILIPTENLPKWKEYSW